MSLKVPPGDVGTLVELLYKGFLRREPDAAGYEAAVTGLAQGHSLLHLMQGMLASDEFTGKQFSKAFNPGEDVDFQRFSSGTVATVSERLRTTVVFSRERFQAAIDATLPAFLAEMPNFGGQRDYLREHFERFYELANIVGALLQEDPRRREVLDVGFSVNTLIMASLMPAAEFKICDRPGMPLPAAYQASAAMVDLTSGVLEAQTLGTRPDVIVFAEVIEHLLANPIRVLGFLLGQLGDHGRVIITTPNFYRRSVIEGMARRDNPQPVYPFHYTPEDAPHFHVREYAMKEMLHFVELAGGFTEAFFYSPCWDDEETRRSAPQHEWGNMVVVAGRR